MEFWENTIENRRVSFRRGMVLAVFLFGIMLGVVLVLVSGQNSQAATIDINTKVAELQKKFPQGKYWNHKPNTKDNPNGYTDNPCTCHKRAAYDCVYCTDGANGCTCNHFAGGGHLSATQCMGFANKLAYDVFGYTTWTTISNPNATQIADIRIGDIVRVNGSHSVFVIGRNGNTITVGEANYSDKNHYCQINWGRQINLTTANITYYERAANYDSVIGNTASNGSTGGTTENTTQQATTEQKTTEAATEEAKPFTGWKKASDNVHYQYYKKNKLQKKKWLTISKKKYYVDSKGYRVTGLVKIGSRQYYFNSKGVLQKKKWITVDGRNYYVGNSGYVLKSQWLYKGNTLVYVKKDGAVAKSEIVKIGSKKYYFNSKGKRSKGFKKVKGKYYYCNSSGVIQKKKWITQKKKTYYLQKSGVRAADQLLKIGKYRYYFNGKGYLVKNKKITYKGIIYKADKKGRCKKIGTVSASEESTEQNTTEEKTEETTQIEETTEERPEETTQIEETTETTTEDKTEK